MSLALETRDVQNRPSCTERTWHAQSNVKIKIKCKVSLVESRFHITVLGCVINFITEYMNLEAGTVNVSIAFKQFIFYNYVHSK